MVNPKPEHHQSISEKSLREKPQQQNWLHEKACIIWPRNPKANDENSSNPTKHWTYYQSFTEQSLHGKPKTRNCLQEKASTIWPSKPKAKWWRLQQPNNTLNLLSELFRGTTSCKTQNQKLLEWKTLCIIWSRKPKPKWWKLQQPQGKKKNTKLL